MINRRKRKYENAEDYISFNTTRKRANASLGGLDQRSSNLGTRDSADDIDDKDLRKVAREQVNEIQDSMDLRADAEESNLDRLDRGARYVRNNKKLKKFNPKG